jgi:fluoride exporter
MSEAVTRTLYVAFGGAVGSVLRFWLGGWIATNAGAAIWGTLFVNVTGSFLIGALAALGSGNPILRYLLIVGVMGGYTTFSAFSLQTLELFQKGDVLLALANVALSVFVCLLAVWLGYVAGRNLS